MSEFEFWKDLGNIFDAILDYQKKNVEFNNRFINPWIRLGNIFDRQDRNNEAMQAYRRATEIDPETAQNWVDLGDAHFKMGTYTEAITAYKKAVELDPQAGWPLSNLALTLVMQGRYEEAIPLYTASIQLLTEDKDKAISWNRLGNVYRKLDDYENAFLSFQKADELDGENTGFRDQLDEIPQNSSVVAPEEILDQMIMEQPLETEKEMVALSVVEETPLEDEVVAETTPEHETELDWLPEEPETNADVYVIESESAPTPAWVNAKKETQAHQESPVTESVATVSGNQQESAINASSMIMDVVETFTEFVSVQAAAATAGRPEACAEQGQNVQKEALAVGQDVAAVTESASFEESSVAEESSAVVSEEQAYEEYLKDVVEPVNILPDHVEELHTDAPQTKVSGNGEVRIAMDTKNAHVWNELGNVYLNSGACEDAIASYSKAIELDRNFAWPYSNLALAYVQKGCFAEAILLYQRSIELFFSDKHRAVTWNRLGNVYRRLNDYDNAIAAYQTADELDPENTTLSLRTNFGLLGNMYAEQKPAYVS